MRVYFRTFWGIISDPESFFNNIQNEGLWSSYRFLLITSICISFVSPIAWALGVDGSSPVNSSLGAQMNVYPWWHDTLLSRYGSLSYIIAAVAILATVHLILLIYTPIMHLVFKIFGGQGKINNSWKCICYGVAPGLIFGFIPVFGLMTGIYATVIQLYIAPSQLYKVKGWRAYLFYILIMSLAIYSYWNHIS